MKKKYYKLITFSLNLNEHYNLINNLKFKN